LLLAVLQLEGVQPDFKSLGVFYQGNSCCNTAFLFLLRLASQICGGLQQIVSRRLPETAVRVLSVCTIHSGPQDKASQAADL